MGNACAPCVGTDCEFVGPCTFQRLPTLEDQTFSLVRMTGSFELKEKLINTYFESVDAKLLASQSRDNQTHDLREYEDLGVEWHWLAAAATAETPASDFSVTDAVGLVAWWLKDTASGKVAMVEHISVKGDDTATSLPSAIDSCRLWFWERLDCQSMKVMLWYEEDQEDHKMHVDKTIHTTFKDKKFRWDRLTNNADGTRGQLMKRARTTATIDR